MITNEALHKKSPQEITALLYEACLDNLEEAKLAIEKIDHFKSNTHLQKANDILRRLGAGLNYEAGIIADQLDALYNYLADKIIEANYSKDIKKIDEVISHVQSIANAWQKAMTQAEDKQSKVRKQNANAYEQTAMYES
ncbi:flagellar export chaperone FliS [Evansella cellulosilytica]|uniref:Flagellar secretion chaperone FliS n=1 Tax=Evansella cellulosilytica (strain ATCC 21833 / DSM 2522 / FERM P-1141 / JCM 9156 / N-4) TaxID=649639 RepID=E6TXT9_EVAC2|nr:flagellar protein FliS [Evansella cellulosilytica DSM 2522]